MTRQKQLDAERAELDALLASGSFTACRWTNEPIGPGRDAVGWQDEAGEEDQSAPGWDDAP